MSANGFESYGRLIPLNQPSVVSAVCYAKNYGNYVAGVNGSGVISGKDKVGASPVSRVVFLLQKPSMSVVRSIISASDGSYQFTSLNRSVKFLAIAIDNTLTYEPAVADNLTPE